MNLFVIEMKGSVQIGPEPMNHESAKGLSAAGFSGYEFRVTGCEVKTRQSAIRNSKIPNRKLLDSVILYET